MGRVEDSKVPDFGGCMARISAGQDSNFSGSQVTDLSGGRRGFLRGGGSRKLVVCGPGFGLEMLFFIGEVSLSLGIC